MKNGNPPPCSAWPNPPTLVSRNLAGYRLWLRRLRDLSTLPEVVPAFCLQAELFRQQPQRSLRQLFRVLAKLPIEAGIVVSVHSTFESSGVNGSIEEPRRDTQRTDPITAVPCSADLIGLAIHVIGP